MNTYTPDTFTQKVRNTIEENAMFLKTALAPIRVIVGVSGGADSVVLLNVLNNLTQLYNLELIVAHVNHGIRGEEAKRDEDFVVNLAKKLGLDYYVLHEDVPKLAEELGKSEEEVGREVRYNYFNSIAGSNGLIATAHNANDNVETLLMRFIRGTSITGLAGIPYKRDNIVRPLLDMTREEIENYAKKNNLEYMTDSTNLVPVYTRNKIRLDLIPLINSINPNFVETLTKNCYGYRQDSAYLDSMAYDLYESLCTSIDPVKINLNELKVTDVVLAKRVILCAYRQVTKDFNASLSSDVLNEIVNGLYKEVGTIFNLGKGYVARLSYNDIVIENRNKVAELSSSFDTEAFKFNLVNVGMPYSMNFGKKYSIHIDVVESDRIESTPDVLYLPFEDYKDKCLILRRRLDGDVFRVHDDMHKKLNRIFTDKKVEKEDRDKYMCICDNDEVLWVIDFMTTRFKNRSGVFFEVKFEFNNKK